MPTFLEPDPIILGFLAYKQVVYLEAVTLFALLRLALSTGRSRQAALLAFVLGAVFVTAKWLPPVINLSSGPLPILGGWVRTSLGGMTAPILCSGLLLAAAVLPGRRYWGLDLLHGLAFAALLGLWAYTLFT